MSRRRRLVGGGLLLALWLLAACRVPQPAPTPDGGSVAFVPQVARGAVATFTPTATPLPTDTLTPEPTATPTLTPTPDPYAGLGIAELAARSYGAGELRIAETFGTNDAFTRYLITYDSDGLTIHGFMNVPHGDGPFPVALVLHGYIEPSIYQTIAYTTRYADALARAGYVAIHPNFRNYPPSDSGPDPFRIGYAQDVLNLIAHVREQGGQDGPLQKARPDAIGLMGHSMGGGITTRVITVDPGVRAAVLYGAMSGDERKNYGQILIWSNGERGQDELNAPDEVLQRISPVYHFERITAPVSIHHGDADATVPPAWSVETCAQLQDLGKTVECFSYPGQPHTFQGEGDQLFIARVIAFFDAHVRP